MYYVVVGVVSLFCGGGKWRFLFEDMVTVRFYYLSGCFFFYRIFVLVIFLEICLLVIR